MTTIRVLVADDQKVVRDGLCLLVGMLPGVEVIGAAVDGADAIRLAAQSVSGRRAHGPAHAELRWC